MHDQVWPRAACLQHGGHELRVRLDLWSGDVRLRLLMYSNLPWNRQLRRGHRNWSRHQLVRYCLLARGFVLVRLEIDSNPAADVIVNQLQSLRKDESKIDQKENGQRHRDVSGCDRTPVQSLLRQEP